MPAGFFFRAASANIQKILVAQAQVRVAVGAVSALPPKTDIRQRN
jgi:hypothetical protein